MPRKLHMDLDNPTTLTKENLSAFLVDELGFVKNYYGLCMENKVVDEKQCTVIWYVEDLKISHLDPNVVTRILGKLQDQDNVHTYLRMIIDYCTAGQFKFYMYQYVDDFFGECNYCV